MAEAGIELVLFEVMRERGRQWVRAKHKDGKRTSWYLITAWSEEIREELLGELDRLRTQAL